MLFPQERTEESGVNMRMYRTIIAVSMPLLMASEAVAQSPPQQHRQGIRIGAVHGPGTDLFSLDEVVRVPLARPALSQESFPSPRSAIVGSLPIADNLNLQVGLLRVTRSRRGEPLRDVGGSHQRIAAAGLSFRF